LSEFPDSGLKVGSIDSLQKRSTRRLQLSGNQAVADHIQHIAVETSCSVRGTSQKGTELLIMLVRFCMKLAFLVQVCTG